MKVIKTQHGTNLLKHLDCCISYYVLSDPPHRPAGGGRGQETVKTSSIQIFTRAQKNLLASVRQSFLINFETKKNFTSVNHRWMEGPVGTMKFEKIKIL